jgi:hypothetical protein
MKNNNDIQDALVAKLKSDVTLVALLKGKTQEVREDQWQGVNFVYPCVRIKLISQIPSADGCTATCEFSILCYSEGYSSKESNDIAWEVCQLLDGPKFSHDTTKFISCDITNLIPADRVDERTWLAEARFIARVTLVV